jgi:prepilin-type N-terminal cleavage/methylation domain-containing protein
MNRAFTLIELMVVIGIMAIAMAIGVPLVYRATHKEGMRKAVADVVEVCSNARRFAIFRGTPTFLVINPRERTFTVEAGAAPARPERTDEPGAPAAAAAVPVIATSGSGLSAHIPDSILIEMLDVNLREYKDAEQVRVTFNPNGTSDEMTLILRDGNVFRKIALEVTTGLADVESDPSKWR